MKFSTSHILIAAFTFALGVILTVSIFYRPVAENHLEKATITIENKPEEKQESVIDKPHIQTDLKSLSPYDLEIFINNNPQTKIDNIWQKLNISGQFNSLPDWEKDESFFSSCNYCEAETFEYNLDDEPDAEVLLRIADTQENSRYLLFKNTDSEQEKWKLLGFIDHDFGRYRMPQHSFLLSGGKSFLVVQVQVQSGTGVAQYNDRLFTVQNGKLIELLYYTSDGHSSNLAYAGIREFSGRVSDCIIKNGTARIEIEFNVKYSGYDYDNNSNYFLWSKKQKAVYTKSLKSNTKKLDVYKSDITQAEIDTIYNIDFSADSDYLKYNLKELKKIAQEKGKRNQWLREFLRFCDSECKTSKEMRILKQILRK